MEFETLGKYRIPAIMIVYNNNAWGVWTSGASRGAVRAQHMYLFQENLRYEKIAEALGCNGEYVTSPDQMTPALERAYKLASDEGISTLINCQGKRILDEPVSTFDASSLCTWSSGLLQIKSNKSFGSKL